METAGKVLGDLSPVEAIRANRAEVERPRAKLSFLLADDEPAPAAQLWPARSRT